MKILAIGANGIIGNAVVENLQKGYEVIAVGHSSGELRVDVEDQQSIQKLFQQIGKVDAIISMVGNGEMKPLQETDDQGFATVINSKIMGQVNLVRIGLDYINPNGSFTLTSGQAADNPMPGTSAITLGVAAINAFVKTAALEMRNGVRINAVSPAMVKETMEQWGIDSSSGIPAADVASYYRAAVTGADNGAVFNAIQGPYQKMVASKPAYLAASLNLPEGHGSLVEYGKAAGPIFHKYGAEVILVGTSDQEISVVEGEWPNEDAKLSLVKFPSQQRLEECLTSDEYQRIKHLRTDAVESKFSIVLA